MGDLAQLTRFIENSVGEAVDLQKILTRAVAIAPEAGGTGESDRAKILKEWLQKNFCEGDGGGVSCSTQNHSIAMTTATGAVSIEEIDAPDSRVPSGVRPNVILTMQGKTRQTLWVITHLDTVGAGDVAQWATPPFQAVEKDGKIFGRGVEDNQQGLVSSIFALLAFKKCGLQPSKTIKLLFAADEENGSAYGVNYLLHNTKVFCKGDEVLIPDGGDSKGETLEIAEKSILWLRFLVDGKEAHGSRPDLGCNACEASAALVVLLASLRRTFGATDDMFTPPVSTFEPTKHVLNVESVNIIPGHEEFYMDCRILPCYKIEDVEKEIFDLCHKIEADYGVKIAIEKVQQTSSPSTNKDCPIVHSLQNALKTTRGFVGKPIGIGGGTVAGELRNYGYDCVVWSTLDDMAHLYNEYCVIDNMKKDAVTMATLFCGE